MPSKRTLEECLREALTSLWAVVLVYEPEVTDLMDGVFEDTDKYPVLKFDLSLQFWTGYVQGMADALDMTLLEMFDHFDIETVRSAWNAD